MGNVTTCSDDELCILDNSSKEIIVCLTNFDQYVILMLCNDDADIDYLAYKISKEMSRERLPFSITGIKNDYIINEGAAMIIHNTQKNASVSVNNKMIEENYNNLINNSKLNCKLFFMAFDDTDKYCDMYNILLDNKLIESSKGVKFYNAADTFDFRKNPVFDNNEFNLYISKSKINSNMKIFLFSSEIMMLDWKQYLNQSFDVAMFMAFNNVKLITTQTQIPKKFINNNICVIVEKYLKITDFEDEFSDEATTYKDEIKKSSVYLQLLSWLKSKNNIIKNIYESPEDVLTIDFLKTQIIDEMKKNIPDINDSSYSNKEFLDVLMYSVCSNIGNCNNQYIWKELYNIIDEYKDNVVHYRKLCNLYIDILITNNNNNPCILIIEIPDQFVNMNDRVTSDLVEFNLKSKISHETFVSEFLSCYEGSKTNVLIPLVYPSIKGGNKLEYNNVICVFLIFVAIVIVVIVIYMLFNEITYSQLLNNLMYT